MSEAFWFNDPAGLFMADNWSKFVPTPDMTVPMALNAVMRFTVYFSIILMGATGVSAYLAAIPLMAVVTVVLYRIFPETQRMRETFVSSYTGGERTMPSIDNPFMNAPLTDILDNPNRPRAADITAPNVREQVNATFAQTSNMYMDTTDAFDMIQSQRNFHSVPEDDHAGLLQFINKGGSASQKTTSETYVAAKGTVSELSAPSVTFPAGTTPSFARA
jgi:hypothetical protein